MFIRRLPKFEYHTPSTLDDAVNQMDECREKGKVVAGGTDLLVSMKKRDIVPAHIINLKGIEVLKGIREHQNDGVTLGSLVTIGDIERSDIIEKQYTVLWDAARMIAAPQIRNLGTIGGNLCSAVPSADTPPPLIALGATLNLIEKNGERSLPVEDFFKGPGESVLSPSEILKEIIIPSPPKHSGGAYLKMMRRNALDLALVGVAVWLRLDADRKVCQDVRIALGAVAPTPIRAREAEKVIINHRIDDMMAAEAGDAASREARPITDIRATKEYRSEMIKVLTKRAVMKALDRAGAKGE